MSTIETDSFFIASFLFSIPILHFSTGVGFNDYCWIDNATMIMIKCKVSRNNPSIGAKKRENKLFSNFSDDLESN